MTKLTTHCLDTFSGKPAKGIKVDIYFVSEKREKLNSIAVSYTHLTLPTTPYV